jgi:hypothetical protein
MIAKWLLEIAVCFFTKTGWTFWNEENQRCLNLLQSIVELRMRVVIE